MSDTSRPQLLASRITGQKAGPTRTSTIASYCQPHSSHVVARLCESQYGHQLAINVSHVIADPVIRAGPLVSPQHHRLVAFILPRNDKNSPAGTSSLGYAIFLPLPALGLIQAARFPSGAIAWDVGSIHISHQVLIRFFRPAFPLRKLQGQFQGGTGLCGARMSPLFHCCTGLALEFCFLGHDLRIRRFVQFDTVLVHKVWPGIETQMLPPLSTISSTWTRVRCFLLFQDQSLRSICLWSLCCARAF